MSETQPILEEEPIQNAIKATIITTAASEATTAVVASLSSTTVASVGLATAVRAAAGAAFPAISVGLAAYTLFSLVTRPEAEQTTQLQPQSQ